MTHLKEGCRLQLHSNNFGLKNFLLLLRSLITNACSIKLSLRLKIICDQICQKGSYTRTVSGLTFHYHSTDTTIDQQFMLVPLPNLQGSAFTEASFMASMDARVVCKWLQLAWPGRQPAGDHYRAGW